MGSAHQQLLKNGGTDSVLKQDQHQNNTNED